MFFMNFQVQGKVVETLLLEHPERRLLVDIAVELPELENSEIQPANARTCFTVLDEELIDAFRSNVTVGDIIRADGTFSQSNYVPHKTSYIDTTFQMQNFCIVAPDLPLLTYENRVFAPSPSRHLH